MKLGRHFQEESEAIPMAPLIDIIFLTLVFFMATAVYSNLESEVDITLPTADSAVQSERSQGEIYINLRDDGAIIINDKEVTLAELQPILNRVAEFFPGGAVIIRGDETAMLGSAIEILDACRKADIQNVAFAALTVDAAETGDTMPSASEEEPG
jgi:biopolymer transport protein ExbD